MADEIVGVLQELSSLVRRLTEQNAGKVKLPEDRRSRGRAGGRAGMDQRRTRKELEKHGKLLETLIARIGRS